MHLNTFIYTTAITALANANPAMARKYGNETMTSIPSFESTGSANLETMPSLSAHNSTASSVSVTTSDIFQITTTSVDKTTLTYTLGPSGSSSVVTTVIENTSTITMTSTLYVTMTIPADESSSISAPIETQFTDEPFVSIEPTGDPSPTGDDEPFETAEPTASEFTEAPTATPTDGEAIDGQDATSTGFFDDTNATLEPIDNSGEPTGSGPDETAFISSEPTVTVTDLLTTTMTVTMEAIPTFNAGKLFQSDEADLSSFHYPGFGSGSGPDFWSSIISSLLGGHGHHPCGVTTVTTTIVDMSTVTVTPTSTGNVPIDPTATPSFGSGNGTTVYPTASSGFLTFLKRSRPTLI